MGGKKGLALLCGTALLLALPPMMADGNGNTAERKTGFERARTNGRPLARNDARPPGEVMPGLREGPRETGGTAVSPDNPGYPTRDRIIFSRTAVGNNARQMHLTGYAVGIWDIGYSINPNVAIGVAIQLPILSSAFIPHVSANVFLSDNFAVGAGVFAGIWSYYIRNIEDYFALFGGGHVAMTYVRGAHMLNLSAMCATGADYMWSRDFIFANGLAVVASLGYRYSVNGNWALMMEVHTPFLIDTAISAARNSATYQYGEIWAVVYGFRGHGGNVFGDFGFMLPLYEEYIRTTWRYLPLGIPYFAVGVQF